MIFRKWSFSKRTSQAVIHSLQSKSIILFKNACCQMKRTRLLNLSKYLRIGVPPSSSGGFHDSFTCSARTFLVFPHFFIFLNCFHSMSSFSVFLILLIVFPHCPHLIRLEQPWFAWHVEDVHEASCFKAEVDKINFYSFVHQVLHLSAAIYIVQDSQNRHNTRNTIAYVKLNIHDNDLPRSWYNKDYLPPSQVSFIL